MNWSASLTVDALDESCTFNKQPRYAKFQAIASVNHRVQKSGEETCSHAWLILLLTRRDDVRLAGENVFLQDGLATLLQNLRGEEFPVRVVEPMTALSESQGGAEM